MVKRASKRLYSLTRVTSYSGVPSRHLLLFGEINPCILARFIIIIILEALDTI